MGRVADENPKARYCVSVWRASSVSFTTLQEAEVELSRLKASGQYDFGEIAEWVGQPDEWKEIEAFDVFEDDD